MIPRASAATRLSSGILLLASVLRLGTAHALPPGGGPVGPSSQHSLDCVEKATKSLNASPSSIALGGSATLTWSVSFTADCTTGPFSLAGQSVSASGSLTVQPMATSLYTLTTTLAGWVATLGQATVTVKLPPAVSIKGSSPEWRSLLLQALGTENTFVHLDDSVDMDLSGLEGIQIARGVTLTTEPPPRGRLGLAVTATAVATTGTTRVSTGPTPPKLGPRLYTKARPRPLFAIAGDNVRLFGFRLIGPHFETEDGSENEENGIIIGGSLVGIEIANLEVAGWSGQGIRIVDYDKMNSCKSPPCCPSDPGVKIHDSYIHNNQHEGREGYGVAVGPGAYVQIEHNLFDLDRHSIFGDGRAATCYRANQNLVLRGGGVHGKWYHEYTHLFDVHGDDNCYCLTGSCWNCGHAGEQFWMTKNAFQYTNGHSIKVRGTPRVKAFVQNNVFAQNSVDDAVGDTENVDLGKGIYKNTVGLDSYGRYGVCDLDGDGKDDLFLATGVTWWYSSGGKMPWRYLATSSERPDQVAVGDFDGDGRCDVLRVMGQDWVIDSGGNGSRHDLGAYDVPFDQVRFGRFDPNLRDHRTGRLPITHAFRRAPDGQWYVVALGKHDWRPIGSSSFPLSKLRFGSFNGDGVTDVLAVEGGHWSISRGGASPWEPLNPKLSDDVASLIIADVDGNGKDDIVRFKLTGPSSGKLEVSLDGRSNWQTLTTVGWPATGLPMVPDLRLFAGRFTGSPGADLLFVDQTRFGRLYSKASGKLGAYSLFAY